MGKVTNVGKIKCENITNKCKIRFIMGKRLRGFMLFRNPNETRPRRSDTSLLQPHPVLTATPLLCKERGRG